ncbi:AAA family ATPase [Mucilaginibacter dorajii]|uniref:ATPase AAA-type core domain-containing protein n=1 Tax=Mucilaginibacter dorajii TaxID=692994 RepID=A0ABP7PHY8_9SPHI|nr:ATP-binding protein [Mucilaginibacter dorajii]MCS3733386.1 putative ATP-dependent endonuclease of OLD family [Mucilaginibacter dorajii]
MSTEATELPRVYLNNAHLKGFKSVEDLTIDFKKGLNILIGKNGSGKSNFLEFVNEAIKYRLHSKVPYKFSKLQFISDDNHSFVIENERVLHSRTIKDNNIEDRTGLIEKFYIDDELKFDNSVKSDLKRKFEFQGRQFTYTKVGFGLFRYMSYQHIYPLFIKFNLPPDLGCIDLPGIFRCNAEDEDYLNWNFPKSLSFIDDILWQFESYYDEPAKIKGVAVTDILEKLNFPNEILENLAAYTNIEDVRFNPNLILYNDNESLIIENAKLDFKINGHWLPWSQLSDGTRRLFYIIAEITNTKGLALLEEPELGIHPHQFNLLMDFLKEQSEDKQIIISTHSPKALDHLSPDELDHILIAYYDLEKGTQIRHLSDKEIKKAQKYMKEVGFFSDYWMLSDLE